MGALLDAVHAAKLDEERAASSVTFPTLRFEREPVGFCEMVLGYAVTSDQARIMNSLVVGDRVAWRAGRKVGKSRTMASLALWRYTMHADALVVLLAPTEFQISQIVWHEVVTLFHQSGRCMSCRLRDPEGPRPCPHSACIDGALSPSCRTGLRAGRRRLFGSSPRTSDHLRGLSGRHQSYFLDESPTIDEEIASTAQDNLAGASPGESKMMACGNPTDPLSWFKGLFDSSYWHHAHTSSLDSVNVKLGRTVVPSLADREWVERRREEYGEDSPQYAIEVLGNWPSREMKYVVSPTDLSRAFDRGEKDSGGELFAGIDPAAGGEHGDASVIVIRRGREVLAIVAFQGGTDRIMLELTQLIHAHRKWPEEPIHINYDSAGAYGADLGQALWRLRQSDAHITTEGLEGRGEAKNNVLLKTSKCARPRDAYWLNMAQRIKTEILLPYDEKLREELLFAEWEQTEDGSSRLIEKKKFRNRLGRSPDRADALAYCLWEGRLMPLSRAAAESRQERMSDPPAQEPTPGRQPMPTDPYVAWNPRGTGLDPYGGGAWGPSGGRDPLDVPGRPGWRR